MTTPCFFRSNMELPPIDTAVDLKLLIMLVALVVTGTSLIVALIGLVYFQWWRNRKRMSYWIITDTLLLNTREDIREKVEIRYEGTSVKDVRLFVIVLENTGYQSIKKEEFEKPVIFQFEPDAIILSVETVGLRPQNIGTAPEIHGNQIRLPPALYNSGDFVTFKTLVSSQKDDLTVDARIVGIQQIEKWNGRTISPLRLLLYISMIAFVLVLFAIYRPLPWPWLLLILVSLGAFLPTLMEAVAELLRERLKASK